MATFVPWVQRSVDEINDKFSKLGKGGTYAGHGEDPPGQQYAADFWTTSKAVHDEVFPWLRANAKRLGIKYVISWERIWSVARSSEGVRAYVRYGRHPASASQGHRNHVHVSFNSRPPATTEAAPTIGVPLMATATPVKLNYAGGQALDADGHIEINSNRDVSLVVGTSEGVDLTATIEIGGLAAGESVEVWWSREWKKTGETTVAKGEDFAITIRENDAFQVRYADKLAKPDTGWTVCLRLAYRTSAKAAKVVNLQVRGWKI